MEKSVYFMKRRVSLLFAVFAVMFIFTQCREDEPEKAELGNLTISPQETLVDVTTELVAHVKVPPGLDTGDTIDLVKVKPNGDREDVGYLLDNGSLALNGDDIKGDGVYSGKFQIQESATGEYQYLAVARLEGDQKTVESEKASFNVFNDLNPGEINALYTLQQAASQKLSDFLGGNPNNVESAVNQLANWIEDQSAVKSAKVEGSTYIEIEYHSGLRGGIVISLLDDDGLSDTRGGMTSDPSPTLRRHNNVPTIPLENQTIGVNYEETKAIAAFDSKTIGNRNVFIFAPFEASWRNNERPHIINILDSLTCGDFQVTSYVNQAATVARLYEIVSYGMVVFSTHGAGGKVILTGEIADTTLQAYQAYKPMMQGDNPKIGISTNMVISKAGSVVTRANVYKIYNTFISALPGEFPQSVILNNSCESDKTALLRDAFIAKGAKTYYGFTETVDGAFCVPVARDVFLTLARDGKKTGEVTRINTTWPNAPNPTFRLRGSSDMHYALQLVNGKFEDGILGWTRSGDGRVISQLGSVMPIEGNYMGIISTGLGYTTQTGSISQSFNISADGSELKLNWNFLSEEFLEYIGSSFQDRFQVVLDVEGVGEIVLLSKTIDGVAAEFGATQETAGNLISVSPDIVFDKGGVFMTGWQAASFDITAYKGKCATIILRCTDVGDSIYDTAILLDQVSIE